MQTYTKYARALPVVRFFFFVVMPTLFTFCSALSTLCVLVRIPHFRASQSVKQNAIIGADSAQ
jgi:hypothetical protein